MADEIIIPIRDVRLEQGRFRVVGVIHGPVRAGVDVEYRVHGNDGSLIYNGSTRLSWPELGAGEDGWVSCWLDIENKQAHTGRALPVVDNRH